MIIQYGACFGTELAMNNQLATHFRVYFQMNAGNAAALASCFGLMNLFARSLGGIFSDVIRAVFMTGGGYRLLASANLQRLVFGRINADFCNQN